MRVMAIAAMVGLFAQPATAAGLVDARARPDGPAGAAAYMVRYRSRDGMGAPGVLSGLVIVPRGRAPAGGRPVLLWTHGTTGVAAGCAPSEAPIRYTQIPALAEMLDRGWLVVAPDYAGLGSRGPHPYLVADRTARAAVDAVTAARDVPGAEAGARFAVWGLSQGGHAALAVGVHAARMAPGLELVGVAAAAPPTDLPANFGARVMPIAKGALTAFVAASWRDVYSAPLGTLGGPRTVRLIEQMARGCALGQGPKLGTVVGALALGRALKRVDVPGTPPWGRLLRTNSIRPGSVVAPLLIAQGTRDQIVAPDVTRAFARAECRQGSRLTYVELPGVEHGQTAERSAEQTLDWLSDRFAGRPVASGCVGL